MKNLDRQISSIVNRKWDKYSKQTNIKYLRRKLKEYGIEQPKYLKQNKLTDQNIRGLTQKLTRQIKNEKKRRYIDAKVRVEENRRKLEKKYGEMLKELNKLRDELGNTREVNMYLKKSAGEFNSLAELNYLMDDYKNIKGEVTFNDLLKIAKRTYGMTLEEMLPLIEEKIAPFNLNSFYGMLKYYGFTEKEIKYLTNLYNNGNYKQKDYILKTLNNYCKGKDRYEEMEDIPDHSIAREVLKQSMEMAFILNQDGGGHQIG